MATNNASNQRKPVNVSEGGTGASTLTSHGVLVGAGTGNIAATAAGTANQVLQSGGAGADPAYSTATYPATASQGDVIYASAANTITGLAKDTNATRYIANTGTSNNPAWAQVSLTNGVTGTLPVGSGGTGATTLTNHGVVIGQATSAVAVTAAGTANQVLQSGGASADPVWSTATYPATTAQGDVLYSSSANTVAGLTKDANATRYLSNQGASNNPSWNQVNLTNGVTGTLPITNGGTNASSMTNTYGVNYYDGSAIVTTTVGTAGHVLTSNGAGVAPTFQAAAGGGVTSLAGTANQITASAATGAVTLSIPSTFIAPGSIEATTTIQADTYFLLPTTSSSAGAVKLNSTVILQGYGTNNLFMGGSSGNYTLTTGSAVKNYTIGDLCLTALTTGTKNQCLGYKAGNAVTTGSSSIYIGNQAGEVNTTSWGNIAIGDQALALNTTNNQANILWGNIAIGSQAGARITTGRYNVMLGHQAGYNLTGTEDFNVYIANVGSAGESNKMRIGTDGSGTAQVDSTYIAGIYNHGSVNNTAGFPSILSTGQIIMNSGNAYTYQTAVNFRSESGTAATGTNINYQRSRSGSTITSGDTLGKLTFTGHDGSGYIDSAQIKSVNSGTVATNRIASDLEFFTHPDSTTAMTQRMVISSTGAVTINSPDSGTGLTVSGGGATITAGGLTVTAGGATVTAGGLTVSAGNCTFAGSYGVTVGGTNAALLIDNTGLIGTTTSSERFKDNIEDMDDESSALMNLRPVTFTWKKDLNFRIQYGLIAEEVYDVWPEMVNLDDEGNPHSVQYHNMTAPLINELIKLAARVEELEQKIEALTKKGKSCQKG